jgi:glycosyltransferase involved in cell wall biosynthesis
LDIKPLISVVIPTFQRPQMLAAALRALVPQLASADAEVVVVDNCPDASARGQVAALTESGLALRYHHEPRRGVAHARNAGVLMARGAYIAFLDDDEVPDPGWLEGFVEHAGSGVTVAFGRIRPRYETVPPPELRGLTDRLFSRDYPEESGADITAYCAHLGTGNALFHKARCFSRDRPFDPRFNRSGGEDIWLIRGLVERGERLHWARRALVEELVPSARTTEAYLRGRRYNQGRLRCIFLADAGGMGNGFKVVQWMAVGLAQSVAYGVLAMASAVVSRRRAAAYRIQFCGGLGKVLWWREFDTDLYGS